jgi:murein L,D-transpeptidase YcbB/YkuD
MKNIEWKIIPSTGDKFKLGERYPQLKPIAERLILLGFIDTNKIVNKDFDVYDSAMVKAIAGFQKATGLMDDGSPGKPTIDKLNVTPQEYIEKIKLNLERFRWTHYTDSTRYILVNIPEFYLHVFENGQEKFNIKVCLGRRRAANYDERFQTYLKTRYWKNKPDDWETPMTSGEVTSLILNPTWTVPPTIIREEIYNESVKDTNYLRDKRFKVYKDGKEVDINEVDLRKYTPDKIPYSFVQDPGERNALGKLKFMFKNRYDIYLHDTPTRRPFTYAIRAVSHGCIRVEKPLILADYVLKDNSIWSLDYVKIEIGIRVDDKTKIAEFRQKRNQLRKNGAIGKTTEVKLEHSIPIFVDYFTSWVDDNGVINFRDDIYGKDKILRKYLFQSNNIQSI